MRILSLFRRLMPAMAEIEHVIVDKQHQGECDLLYALALLDRDDPLPPRPELEPVRISKARPLSRSPKRFKAPRWPNVDLD